VAPNLSLTSQRGLTILGVTVKAIGVWDTVGSLGLPRIGVLQNLGLQRPDSHEMSFYDTKLPDMVENAFQALALDERRTSFAPAVWEKPDGNRTVLQQVWFPGVHSNIGGGYDDANLSNLSLVWMISLLSEWVQFAPDIIPRIQYPNPHTSVDPSRRRTKTPWSFGRIRNSLKGLYTFGGGTTRTPGRYHAVYPEDESPSDRPLRRTHEYIHPSVRTRFVLRGPGVEDQGDYEPEALLKGWRLQVTYPKGPRDRPEVVWRARKRPGREQQDELPEWRLGEEERVLLAYDREMEDEVMNPPATRR